MTADAPVALTTEVRYPLDLTERASDIRRLYHEWCADPWDPEDLVDRDAVARAVEGDGASGAAGGLAWSLRSWLAYRDIAASEAAVVRLCLERDRDADTKFLLTARGASSARIAETCWLVADALGGYEPGPPAGAWRQLLGVDVARRVLDAGVDVDASIVADVVVGDRVQLALWDVASASTAAPAFATVLARLRADAARMVRFGSAYLDRNLGGLPLERRAAVGVAVDAVLREEERGLHVPAAAGHVDASGDRLAAATRIAARAGLGFAPPDESVAAVRAAADAFRVELAALGITVPGAP